MSRTYTTEQIAVGDLEWDAKPGRPARPTTVYRVRPLEPRADEPRTVQPNAVQLEERQRQRALRARRRRGTA